MSGGWAGSNRSDTLPPDWTAIRARVHKRSRRTCEWPTLTGKCGRPADGGVDHIGSRDDHSMKNLRDSCHSHHGKKSSAQGNDAKAAKAALRLRPDDEPHPGRLPR